MSTTTTTRHAIDRLANLREERRQVDRRMAAELHAQGQIASVKMGFADYGEGQTARDELIQQSGVSQRQLYRLRLLVERVPLAEFNRLLDRGVPFGHLLRISQVRDERLRRQLISMVQKKPYSHYSYRQLEFLIRRLTR